MIPILYRAGEKDFLSNGIGRLTECIDCEATEERNSIFECQFIYPVKGRFYKQMTENGGTISVIHSDKKDRQAFDIYKFSAPIDGNVTFYAKHISYRLSSIIVQPFTAYSCADALNKIKSNSFQDNPFSFWTDKNVSASYVQGSLATAKSLLAGQEGSILDVYGKGEYEFDMFSVKLYTNRGTDSGVNIRYGKNLQNIRRDYDTSGTFNGVAPYWKGPDGEIVTLPEVAVFSNNGIKKTAVWTNENDIPITTNAGEEIEFQYIPQEVRPVDFTDAFETEPTESELREAAIQYLNRNEPWTPNENITVDFVQLWQTDEYKDVAALQRVSLCDTVSIYFTALGLSQQKAKVIKVVYDVLREKYKSMELGKPQSTVADVIASSGQIKQEISKNVNSDIAEAINLATTLITGGLGGHVVLKRNGNGQPEEILIMDTADIHTAVNVWRWNLNGLGHSHNGYNGPYDDVALTMDGKINASMILTGYIVANFIKGGTLTLGGDENADGIWIVNDANGNEVARGDKDGVTSKALTATDFIYLNGGKGSYLNIPLSHDYPTEEYMRISNDRNRPFYIRTLPAGGTPVPGVPATFFKIDGEKLSIGREGAASTSWDFSIELSPSAIDIISGGGTKTEIRPQMYSVSYLINGQWTRIFAADQSGIMAKLGNTGQQVSLDNTNGLIVQSDDAQVIIYTTSGNLFAKMGKSVWTGEPELQLVGQNGQGDIYLSPGHGIRINNTILTENQLQRLLALI